MQPLQRAVHTNRAQMKIQFLAYLRTHFEEAAQLVGKRTFTESELEAAYDQMVERELSTEIWKNELYTVQVHRDARVGEGWPPMVHLSIRRNDRKAIRDWRHFQQIKNQLVGEENEGLELYPAESRLLDSANQYHIYVCQSAEVIFPFGYTTRQVTEETIGNSVQRPFDKPPVPAAQTGESP